MMQKIIIQILSKSKTYLQSSRSNKTHNVQRLTLMLVSLVIGASVVTSPVQAIEPSDAPEFISTFGSRDFGLSDGKFKYPNGITIDQNGNIYVVDTGSSRIQKFSSGGAYLSQWGTSGTGNGQFSYPESIAIDSAGNLYVSDSDTSRIQKFDSNGVYLTQWGTYGTSNGQFSYPGGITTDSADNIYVADSNNKRIQKFSSTGTYLTQWGTSGTGNGQFTYPYGITTDSADNVYVTDNSNRIQKFSSTGTYLTQWGTSGSGNGQFSSAYGITIDQNGNIYVVDTYNHRIQKFGYPKTADLESPSGSQEIQLTTPAAADISNSEVVTEASLEKQDQSNTFPLGLIDFELTVPTGSTQQITLTFETDLTPSEVAARKYHSTNKVYGDVPGATITETTLGGEHALLLTYDIADGGSLDDDSLANGTIVDPVGLAVANGAAAPGAPNSGAGIALSLPILTSMVGIPALVYAVQKRRSRR